jgi:hypothetical protein
MGVRNILIKGNPQHMIGQPLGYRQGLGRITMVSGMKMARGCPPTAAFDAFLG